MSTLDDPLEEIEEITLEAEYLARECGAITTKGADLKRLTRDYLAVQIYRKAGLMILYAERSDAHGRNIWELQLWLSHGLGEDPTLFRMVDGRVETLERGDRSWVKKLHAHYQDGRRPVGTKSGQNGFEPERPHLEGKYQLFIPDSMKGKK